MAQLFKQLELKIDEKDKRLHSANDKVGALRTRTSTRTHTHTHTPIHHPARPHTAHQ